MSWGTCYSGSNNIHFGFPPIMSDGRNYSQWQPGAVVNKEIQQQAHIQSNWEYRKYLTENANSIIEYNQLSSCNEAGGCPYYGDNTPKTNNSPFLYKSSSDQSQPYGYETSDLKNLYLSRSMLQSRMVAPTVSQDQLLQYYSEKKN